MGELGVLVSANSFRHPALLLKQAITVDHLSGGRLDLGLGTGWSATDHESYGLPLPANSERLRRLAEALTIIEALQGEERTTIHGEFYSLRDAPFVPKPVQARLPIVLGGPSPGMLRLVARHADVWNSRLPLDAARQRARLLDQYLREEGRDPSDVRYSIWPTRSPWSSVEAVASFVEGFMAAGFDDFALSWPSDRRSAAVMHGFAHRLLPEAARGAALASRLPWARRLARCHLAVAASRSVVRRIVDELPRRTRWMGGPNFWGQRDALNAGRKAPARPGRVRVPGLARSRRAYRRSGPARGGDSRLGAIRRQCPQRIG